MRDGQTERDGTGSPELAGKGAMMATSNAKYAGGQGFWTACAKCGKRVMSAPDRTDAKGRTFHNGNSRDGRDCRPANFKPTGQRGAGAWAETAAIPGLRQVRHGSTPKQHDADYGKRQDALKAERAKARAEAKAKTTARKAARQAKATA